MADLYSDNPADLAAIQAALGIGHPLMLIKADPYSPVFATSTGQNLTLKAGTRVALNGRIWRFDVATAVTLPTLTAGTDYAVYICEDGVLRGDANFSVPTGWTTANSRQIGGFHYAPGGNAAGYNLGGDTTPSINPFSIWDQKFRPSCPDPRGMTLVAGRFWIDIYMLGVDHHVNGTSRNGVTIADSGSQPKTPLMFGGNGTTTVQATWFNIAEIMASHGKRLPDYAEFAAAAFGAQEAKQRGNDPVTTGLGTTNAGSSNTDEKFTSRWGVIQAVGVQWIWGRDLGYRVDGADVAAMAAYSWKAQTGGRGSLYTQSSNGIAASLFGGRWSDGSGCGSRSSYWVSAPWDAGTHIGGRGLCDHLVHV